MALFGRFFGRAAAEGAGFAFGRASAPVLSPALEEIRQEAWKVYATRLPDVAALASGVAEGKVDSDTAHEWAERHGFGKTSFNALVSIATTAPDVGTAMQAWRRRELSTAQFEKVLKRHGIADEWVSAIEALRAAILDPADLARAIHKGLIPDPGLLEGEQPTSEGKVPAYPVYNIDAIAEAMASGYDRDRLGVLVGLQGNPASVHEASQAAFRGIATWQDVLRAGAESNTRNEWVPLIYELSRQIPTARDYIENALRGYRTLEEAQAGAARHGMSPEDARLIFQNSGRPLNLHQITQALEWGGKYDPQPGDDADPYMNSVLIGAVTPAYYDLQRHLKYNLPSALYFRTLQQNGVLKEADAAMWYRRLGWPPELANQVAKAYASGAGSGGVGPWAKKAETQLWTATHKGFINGEVSESAADAALASIGIGKPERDEVFKFWNEEKNITVKPLTPSQIKAAYKKNEVTLDDAVARLELQHYTDADARTYLTT